MNRRSLFIRIMVLLLTAIAVSTGASRGNGETPRNSRDTCLGCHGPFDKLAAATAGYVTPNGEKITPHRYVPHDSKETKAIPDCANCHQPHPLPLPPGKAAAAKPDVQWCYSNCHHQNNFESCKKCHQNP